MPQTNCQIGWITLKNGGTRVRVLQQPNRTKEVIGKVAEALADHSDLGIEGYAFVVWGKGGQTYTFCSDDIPDILVPDFVRNVLLMAKIESVIYQNLIDPAQPAG